MKILASTERYKNNSESKMISTECSNYTQYEGRKFHCSLLGQLHATENHLTKILYLSRVGDINPANEYIVRILLHYTSIKCRLYIITRKTL